MTVASFWAGTSTEIKITNRLRGSTWSGRGGRGFGRISGGVWEELFNSDSGVPAELVLDYAGVEDGQFFAGGDNTKTFANLHTFARASLATKKDDAGLVVSVSSGAHRLDHNVSGDKIGLLIEASRKNICLWSDDWTSARSEWNTATNITRVKDQVGADGVTNSATSLRATSGNAIVMQAITATLVKRTYSVHIKRLIGTGNIELTQNGGTLWLDKKASINSETFTQVATARADATNPEVGIRIVTSGDKIAVQYSQSEITLNGGNPASSAIPTTTVTVTRALEAVKVATSGFSWGDHTGTLFAEATTPDTSFVHLVGFVGNEVALRITGSSGIRNSNDLSDLNATAGSGTWATGLKVAVSSSESSGRSLVLNGGTLVTDAGIWRDTTPIGDLHLGSNNGTAKFINGHIRHIVYFASRLSDDDMEAMAA